MIRPFVLLDSALKLGIVVGAAADVDDEEVIVVVLMGVVGDVSDGVAVDFF